jgi:transcription-repair coupling factor (superfamily II helicase)
MKTYLEPLSELAEYREIREKMKNSRGILSLTGCIDAQRAHMIYGLSFDVPCTVIITENELAAKTFFEDFRFYEPAAGFYPAKDLLFYSADLASNLLDRQRMDVLENLTKKRRNAVILPAQALMDRITSKEELGAQMLHFKTEETADLEQAAKSLANLGYSFEPQVGAPGQFSIRGDILDIWNLTSEKPVRIELFGDEIESIRCFDPETQRSLDPFAHTDIYPANDHTSQKKMSLLEWFDPKKTVFFLSEPNRIEEALRASEAEFTESIKNRIDQGTYDKEEVPEILGAEEIMTKLSKMNCVTVSSLDLRKGILRADETYSTTAQAVNSYNNSFEFLVKDLRKYQKMGYRTVLLSGSHTRAQRLAYDLNENDLHAFYSEDGDRVLENGEIMVQYGHASRGFEYPMIRFVVISETDIFGEKKKKKKKKNYTGQKIASFAELSPGDYVVHENHGLGIYRGIEKVPVEGVLKDYIKLEYNGSNLYVLATQLDVLQKYSGSEGRKPRLNRLDGNEWKNTKTRVRSAVADIAKSLVELYAVRQSTEGYKFGKDTAWQKEFEELFPYEETDDQLAAIEDTKRDMESHRIMDRLICGDVGYGKTEIALRAAFKAVQESKQVAYLVPTTILAQQHYNTFLQRTKDFPVRTDLLCRFRTPAQQEKTIRDLKNGQVDIVIGTHRLISKDVKFKDLGLLIIDEEQRFGVAHKEKIKQMRKNVDVLTLTATPIPRTLHMSLIGIRDMSVLEEPPQDRVPIQTYVMEYNPEMVREAICRELNRKGQVYYVYNRVQDIADMTRRIQALVPEASVAFADGQMEERDLENIMVDFINGNIDVLVTTTIIETGLDIPNVNTMIVHDADRMGLSQLYQLRGRVGRSNRTAYAFLMYRRDKVLQEVAEKRLSAIREFTELGSGIKIAMRDLEIRGAGNLLGAEQHGHMEAVGYDLYCKLLSEAVRTAKGQKEEEDFETVVDLTLDAYVPDAYIPDEFQKLDIYKRIAGIEDDRDFNDMSDELMDRFGPLPKPVRNLLLIADLKAYAHKASITEIKQMDEEVKLSIYSKPSFDVSKLPEILDQYDGDFQFHAYATGSCFIYREKLKEEELPEVLKTFVISLAQTGQKDYNM